MERQLPCPNAEWRILNGATVVTLEFSVDDGAILNITAAAFDANGAKLVFSATYIE